MNPTVSESSTSKGTSRSQLRVLVSRVEKRRSSIRTSAPVRRFSIVDFPELV